MGDAHDFASAKAKHASVRFLPADRQRVLAAQRIRQRATALRDSARAGSYNRADLAEFWQIAADAPLSLEISNSELSERAGLGTQFFTSVVRERRRPKLTNYLRALSVLIDTANERLADAETTVDPGPARVAQWRDNPLLADRELAERLERELRDLIEQLHTSNRLFDDPAQDRYWRESLIKTLETVLALLRAPLVETGFLKRAAGDLKKVGAKVTADSSAGFFDGLAGAAATTLIAVATKAMGG